MIPDQSPVRTYGGWRRTRGIGLLGLGPAATFALLGCLVAVLIVAAISLRTLLFVGPPALLAAAAALIRPGGTPLAQLAVQRLRWWYGTRAGHTGYRAEVVTRHAGVLQLPGTLAATELLSAEDGYGGRYGLVRDRHSGYLTATLRVVPTSTWLANTGDADSWVANWGAWLASLGYLPAVRWVTVTIDTAPDPGSTLADQVAASLDPAAPRPALEIMDQLVATAPAAAADVDTRVSVTLDPSAYSGSPGTVTAALADTGQVLAGLESALASCGLTVLGRARAADIAGIVRTAFDPGGPRRDLPAAGRRGRPGAGGPAELGQRRPGRRGRALGLLPARQRHVSVLGMAARHPGRTCAATCSPASSRRAPTPSGSPCSTGRSPPRRRPASWTARSGRRSSAASTPAAPAATSPPATPTTTPAPGRPPTRKPAAPESDCSACTSPSPSPTPASSAAPSPTPSRPPSCPRSGCSACTAARPPGSPPPCRAASACPN